MRVIHLSDWKVIIQRAKTLHVCTCICITSIRVCENHGWFRIHGHAIPPRPSKLLKLCIGMCKPTRMHRRLADVSADVDQEH